MTAKVILNAVAEVEVDPLAVGPHPNSKSTARIVMRGPKGGDPHPSQNLLHGIAVTRGLIKQMVGIPRWDCYGQEAASLFVNVTSGTVRYPVRIAGCPSEIVLETVDGLAKLNRPSGRRRRCDRCGWDQLDRIHRSAWRSASSLRSSGGRFQGDGRGFQPSEHNVVAHPMNSGSQILRHFRVTCWVGVAVSQNVILQHGSGRIQYSIAPSLARYSAQKINVNVVAITCR